MISVLLSVASLSVLQYDVVERKYLIKGIRETLSLVSFAPKSARIWDNNPFCHNSQTILRSLKEPVK